jgi:hypothetical protein
MDWCGVYLTPEGLPKYIYLSPPLIFPTTYYGIRTKNCPVWIAPGAAPIRLMGLIRNPRWEQKRTEGYVIVSNWHIAMGIFVHSLLNWTPWHLVPWPMEHNCPNQSDSQTGNHYQHRHCLHYLHVVGCHLKLC